MDILVIWHGEYGKRIFEHVRDFGAADWTVREWRPPKSFPPIIDDPDDFLPDVMAPADLILSLGEDPGVADLLPDVAKRAGAKAVIVAIDSEAWVPAGLAAQLAKRFEEMGIEAVFPKPLCSLNEETYGFRKKVPYESELISEFASRFGQPKVRLTIEDGAIAGVSVERDACCGCARYVAKGLKGVSVRDAEFEAGMLHHHYPCLATMGIDETEGDTLMHVSGRILKDEVAEQVKPHKAPGSKLRPSEEFEAPKE